MSEEKPKIPKEEKKETKEEVRKEEVNLHKSGPGLNLIAPQLQKVEQEKQEKFRLDIRVVLFVFFVVLISLGVVGYNGYVNVILSSEKAMLEDMKEDLRDYEHVIEANNQIIERYNLYNSVLEGFISSKEVLTFWQEVSENLGEIRGIELSRGVDFEVRGSSESLRDVTKLWHFLSIDDRVKSVTLESLSIPRERGDDLNFSFKGVLNLEYFNKRR